MIFECPHNCSSCCGNIPMKERNGIFSQPHMQFFNIPDRFKISNDYLRRDNFEIIGGVYSAKV